MRDDNREALESLVHVRLQAQIISAGNSVRILRGRENFQLRLETNNADDSKVIRLCNRIEIRPKFGQSSNPIAGVGKGQVRKHLGSLDVFTNVCCKKCDFRRMVISLMVNF